MNYYYYNRYLPYPYHRRYYNIDPYYYRRYYTPFNIYNSQFADVNQNISNFGDMSDVIQNADVFQSMSEPVGMCTSPMVPLQESSSVGMCTSPTEPPQEPIHENPGDSTAVPFPI